MSGLTVRHTQLHTASLRRRDGHTIDGIPGDCWRAAVASLVNEPDLLAVPHFALHWRSSWDVLQRWLHPRGLAMSWAPLHPSRATTTNGDGEPLYYSLPDSGPIDGQVGELVLLCGPSPRGPFSHVVVGTPQGEVVHDPHPSRAGLDAVHEVDWLVPAALRFPLGPPMPLALPAPAGPLFFCPRSNDTAVVRGAA